MRPAITFGTDGWRGIVGDDFTFDAVRCAAQGVGDHLSADGRPAVVGYDCRFASEVFAEEVARVLAASGIRTLLFDRAAPTQVASWTVIAEGAAGGVVITASHNPYLFNGFKYKPETGSSAPPEVVSELERRINEIADRGPDAVRQVAADHELIVHHDPRPSYMAQVGRMLDLDAIRRGGLRVVHDAMHGSGAGYVAELLRGGTTSVVELRPERNPFFGGVNPEPIPSNLASTLAYMEDAGADLCICTDGDADRVGIVDEKGRFVNQLQVYALLMRYLIELRGWRGAVVKSLNMTSMAEALAERYGVEVHEVQVGFKNIAPRMLETDAVLGGEESGGFAFRGHMPERDGILAGLCFADMIVRTGRPLSELLRELEEMVGPRAYARHDHHLPRGSYQAERERVLGLLRERAPREVAGVPVARLRDDDGYKFTLADGSWVLIRTSGTEPLIRVYSEAATQRDVEARLTALEDLVEIRRDGSDREGD